MGYVTTAKAELGTIDFWFMADEKRIHKTVHHYLLEAQDVELSDADAEVAEVAWVPLDEVATRLRYADERRLVERDDVGPVGLLRRLAAATVQAEMLEARMVNGEAIDIATLCTLASTTVRLSQRLGLERARNVTPSVSQYLATRTATDAPDAEGTE